MGAKAKEGSEMSRKVQLKTDRVWEQKSMEQDNARFERSVEMFHDAQSRQMEQTNAIVSGFKDIFKDLVSK